jgi:uncharacterized protein YbjQ (UPF0145 family)
MREFPFSKQAKSRRKMIITTLEQIEGKKITQVLGVVMGNKTVGRGGTIDRTRKDVTRLRKSIAHRIVGEEIGKAEEPADYYAQIMDKSRGEAIQEMINEAEEISANAVVGIRFTTSMITSEVSEVLVYGTAVKIG